MNMTYFAQTPQTYGTGLYGECAYTDASMCGTEVPGTPNTGFVAQHPALSITIIAVLAVVLYAVALLVVKKLRSRSSR